MAKSAGGKNTGRSEIIGELKELRSLIAGMAGMKADVEIDTSDVEKANDELTKLNEKMFEAQKTLKRFKSTGQIHYFATQEKALAHLTRAWEEYKKASSEDDKKTASGKLMRWANAYRGAGYSTDSVEKEMFETADRIYESYKTTGKKGESNSQKLWARDVFEKVFGAAREVGVDVTESDKYWERRARNIRETAKKVTQESVEQAKSEPVELDVAELLKIDESGLDARAKKIMKSLRKTRDKLIDENNEPTDKSLGKNQGPQFLTDYEEFLKYKENSGNKYRIRGIKKTRDIVLQEMGLKDTDEDLAPFKLQAQQNLNKALEKANRAVRRARQKSGAAPAEGSSTEGGNPQTQGSMTQAGEDARDAGQAAKDAAQSFEEAGDKAQKAGKKAAASAEETREAAEETKKAAKEASEAQDEASVGRGGNKPAEDARETAAALNEERDAARGVNEERERIAAASGSGDNTASRARENAAALDEEKKAQQEVNDERSKMDKTSGQNEEPLSYLDAMILKLEEEKEKLKELQDESDKTRKMLDAASDVKELKKVREIIHGVMKNNQTGETKQNAFGFEGNPAALGSLVRKKISEGNMAKAAAYYGEYAKAGGTDKFSDITGKDITAELAERYKQAAEAIGKNPDELRKALNEVNKKILTQREVVSQIEKEVKAAQKEAAAQRKEQAQQEQETNTDWQNGLNEQEIEAVEAYLKKMKALKKEAYNESTALAQAMSLLEKIKKRDISGLMDQFTAPNKASNAMLGKMTNMPVNNQAARDAALRSLNQEEYDRLIQEQTRTVNDALDNKKSDFQQKWAEVANAMLGGDVFVDAKPMVKGQILKELEKYADTAKDAIDEINKQWLSGTLDESKFSGKYAKQYIAALDAAKEAAENKREAEVGDPDIGSLFTAEGTTTLTQEQVDALHAEAAAYDDLIAKKKEYYGISTKPFGKQVSEDLREIDDWIGANTNKQMYPPVVKATDTVEQIEAAITKIEEFRDKLKSIQENSQFSMLSTNMQSDVQNTIRYLETLINTEKGILETKKEFDRQTEEPNSISDQENESQIKLLGTLEQVEQAYKDLAAAKEAYEKAKATKESFTGITDQSALIRERRRRSYDAYEDSVVRYQEAFSKYNGFFESKQDAEEWGKRYDATHIKEVVVQEEDSVARSQAAIRAEIDETNEIIKEQEAWFGRVNQVNDEITFKHKDKRKALKELKQSSAEYKELKENPDDFDEIETARRLFRYQNAGTHAEQLGLDPEVISQYWTKLPLDQFKEETRKFAEESARRNVILYEAKERLQELTIEYNKAEVAALSSELGTTIRKEQNKINREIKAYENGVLETQSHENQKLILEKYDNAPRKSSAEFLDFQSTEEYSKLDERGKSLVDGLIQAYQKLEMIKKDGGLEYLQMLKQEKELTEEIGDVREKLFNAQDSERNGDKVDATSLLSEKETIDSIIEKLKLLDSEKAKTYGIFGTSKHEAGTGDIQKQIDSLIQAKNDIDAILERVGQSASSSSNASTFADDIKSLGGYSSANEDFVNQLIADVITGQKEYDQAMNELKTHIAQRQEEIRAEEELRTKRVRNAGFGEDVKALENYGYADKDFVQKLTAQVLEGTKEYDDAMDELKAHIEQKHAEMMAVAEKSNRDNTEIGKYYESAKPIIESMGLNADEPPEEYYRFVDAIREEGIEAEEALRRFADAVGYVYDEVAGKWQKITESKPGDQSSISSGVGNPKFDFSSKSFDELVNISDIKKGSDELNAALRESMEHLVEMYNAGNTESEEYYGTLYRIINLQKQMWKFNEGNGSGYDALAQSTKDAFSEQTKEKMRLQDSILEDLKKYSGIDLGVIDSAIQIITDLKNDVGEPLFQPFKDGKPMSADKFKKYYLDMLRERSNETPVSQGDTTSSGLDSSIGDTIQDNNNKAIASTEELISTVKELEEIYSKFQRPKYEKQESSYIDQLYNVEGIDLSGYNSVSISEDNIKQTRQKMMEIYSLYKKVTSAIKNNAGYYKGVQYTDADQENLIKDFKAYAQNYHELVTEYNDREGRISKDIGIDPEYLETLDVVVQKLTKDFRGYAQEVITDSQSVSDNNRLYEEEQVQLEQSNAALRERYNLLRNQVLDYAKSKGIDDNQLDTIREMIPFIRESGFQDWGDLFDWGDISSLEHLDTVVNVLQEILRILGIEIPEAAGKAKKAISEVGEGSTQPSEQEAPKTEPSNKKYRISPTSPKIKSKSEPETTPPPSKPDTTDESAAADEAAAAAAEKEAAAKEGAAAAAEKKAAAEKNDSEATRENAAENQANTDAEDFGEDISGVGGRASEAAERLNTFTQSARDAAEAARKAAGIKGESRIISRSGVNGTSASATYELARGMHYTENWSYRNGNEETGEEPGWAMTSARYVINYQALLTDTVTTLKALRKAEADLALAQEQGRGENVTSQIQAQINLYQKRIAQNATLAEQYEKMRDLEIEDFELRDGYTKHQYDEDLKTQEELINAQSGAKKAKSVDDERKRQTAKQDKEVARAQKYATERLVALKQLESSFTTEGSSRYLSVEDDRTAITGMAGKLRTKLEDIIKQNRAMTIDEMDNIITQFGDIKVEGDTRYSRSTAKKGDLSRQKVDSLKNVLSSDLDAFSQQAERSSGNISHITEEVNKLKEALNGNVSSEFITESFQKLRELRAELKAINEEQRTKTATEKTRQAEIKLVTELQESYIKLAEAEEKRDHASTETGRELGRRQSDQIKKRQEELKKRVESTLGKDFANKAVAQAEAEANKLRTAYANDRNEGISTKGLGFGENDDVERTWDTLIAKAQQYQKILYKQESGGTITVNEAALLQKLGDLYQQAGEKAEEAGEKGQKFNEAVAAAQQAVRDSVISKYSEAIGGLTAGNKNMPEAYNKQVEELKNNLEQLKNIDFDTTEWGKMVENLDAGLNNLRTNASMRPITDGQKAQLDRQMASWMNSNSGAGEFLGQVQRLRDALSNVRDEDEFNGIQSDFEKVRAAAADAGKTGESFGEGLKKRFKSLGQYLLSFASFYRVIDVFKQAFNTVKQLDDALTEMRKVSDESLSSLQRYQSLSFNMADEVGTTAQQIQQSTADWLRLGESFEEAQKSAKESTILLNVSEFENIDKATEALVSASQAYKDLDKIDIIDKLNNIGNNFSISTDQLATGLQNSAAVLMTQGNDIDEALALLTAGNAITQDISKTSAGITYARTYSNIRVLKTRKQLYRSKTRDGSDRAKTLGIIYKYMDKYYNVSSVRMMRFLYSLGFDKESYINRNGKENWRFKWSSELQESLDFFFYMRNKLKEELVICQ